MSWLRRMLGIHSPEEIVAAVEAEPTISKARNHLARADRILHELEQVERGPTGVNRRRRAGDHL